MVDTLPIRQLEHLLVPVWLFDVVDQVGRAEFLDFGELCGRGGCGDDSGAGGNGELEGDAARNTVVAINTSEVHSEVARG